MECRQLGKNGPRVSAIGLGMWPLVGGMGRVEEKDAIATIRHALDSGITVVDAAQSYENSEELLGKALRDGYRSRCFIATKVSWKYSRSDVEAAIESSLRKLGVDYVDLYQVHGWWDHKYPIEETMNAMATVRDQGKARFIGVSNFNADQMKRTLGITSVQSNQILYNMFCREREAEDIPYCGEQGIGVIAHTAMAHGLLSGRLKAGQKFAEDDYRSRLDRFKGRTFAQCLEVAGRLEGVAKDKGISLVQLALAWTLRNGAVSCLLAGAKRPSQIDEQLDAPGTRFSADELERIEEILKDAPDLMASAKPSLMRRIAAFVNRQRRSE
jgi:aryl-alcohol dehydrogenase-like predicted oxidoreductase